MEGEGVLRVMGVEFHNGAADQCLNMLSTHGAICCDKDKILTLEWRKCSVSRNNGRACGAGDQREKVLWGMGKSETFFMTKEQKYIKSSSSLSIFTRALCQNSLSGFSSTWYLAVWCNSPLLMTVREFPRHRKLSRNHFLSETKVF